MIYPVQRVGPLSDALPAKHVRFPSAGRIATPTGIAASFGNHVGPLRHGCHLYVRRVRRGRNEGGPSGLSVG